MIQSSSHSNISSSTDFASTDFSIEVNSSMFQLLTSNIYGDPIAAVIREWSTNALDSCIEANKPLKFDVHLPTDTEPTFMVRDYGTGLSQDSLVTLFCTLGASTKRESNDLNGTFGIGRMAGLAYASSFTVQSYHEGQSHTYLISITEGVPKSLHIDSSPSDQPSGLTLTLPVQPSDIHKFDEKAAKIYRYFDHKPNLNKPLDIAFPSGDLVFTSWFVDTSLDSWKSTNYLLMANVLYEVRSSDIDTQSLERLVIRADTGDVTINPGRESLSYDKKTIDYLNQRFKDIHSEYVEFSYAAIEEQDTPYQQLVTLQTASSNAPRSIRYKLYEKTIASNPIISSYFYINGNYSKNLELVTQPTNIAIKFREKCYTNPKSFANITINLHTFANAKFLLIDQATNFSHAYSQINGDLIILSRPTNIKIDEFLPIAKQWLDNFGIPYTLSSSYTNYCSSDSKAENRTAAIYVSDTNGSYVSKSYEASPNTNYLYVPLSGTSFIDSDEDILAIYTAICLLKNTGTPLKLVGVPKKYISEAESASNFTLARDYLQLELDKYTFSLTGLGILNARFNIPNPPKLLADYYQTYKDYKQFRSVPNIITPTELERVSHLFTVSTNTFTPLVTRDDVISRYPHYFTLEDELYYTLRSDISPLADYVKLQEHYYDTTCQTSGQSGDDTNS